MSIRKNATFQKLKEEGVNIQPTPMKKKDWKMMFSHVKRPPLTCTALWAENPEI